MAKRIRNEITWIPKARSPSQSKTKDLHHSINGAGNSGMSYSQALCSDTPPTSPYEEKTKPILNNVSRRKTKKKKDLKHQPTSIDHSTKQSSHSSKATSKPKPAVHSEEKASTDTVQKDLIVSSDQVYRKRFLDGLKLEKTARRECLARFNGDYTVFLTERSDATLRLAVDDHKFHKYGYIDGLKDDEVECIIHAVDKNGVELRTIEDKKMICKAQVLQSIHCNSDGKLNIAFDTSGSTEIQKYCEGRKSLKLHVQFSTKTSYFSSLEKSVRTLPSDIIHLISPKEAIFDQISVGSFGSSLGRDQVVAIETIVTPDHRFPEIHSYGNFPIVISGAFGTGKTYVLAVATNIILNRTYPNHILVCTQQRQSAENFISTYIECHKHVISPTKQATIYILIEKGKHDPQFYITPQDLKMRAQTDAGLNQEKLLIVTTCSTWHKLSSLGVEFTHIMIDECGLMREPEAIAPLCVANSKTRIIIAGDPQQVGPQMLVLGSEAKKSCLGESLLERLLKDYQELGEVTKKYHVTLSVNYRCHPDIVSLLQPLFYPDKQIKCQPQLIECPNEPCLIFSCSNIRDEKVKASVNLREAEILHQELLSVLSRQPHSLIKPPIIGIMTRFRNQLSTIQTLVKSTCSGTDSGNMLYIPTSCMQGMEYDTLFLSTTEPISHDTDGNPKISDLSESLSNPYVFNTAISRARKLIVVVGNPILLLRIEKNVIEKEFGENMAKCWSNYLKYCLENGTFVFNDCLGVVNDEKDIILCLNQIRRDIETRLGCKIEMHQSLQQYNNPSTELLGPRITKLEEDYTEIGVLGSGGYGVVFHVQRATDKQDYALKLIDVSSKRDQERTKEEANKLAILKHDNIVQYYNSGFGSIPRSWGGWKDWKQRKKRLHVRSTSNNSSSTDADRKDNSESICLYILTEWCEAGTLRDWLNSHMEEHQARVRLKILQFFSQIIDALGYIHEEKSIAHRDLKPSNIFLIKEGVLKIGDFGFVKEVGTSCTEALGDTLIGDSASLSKYYGTEFYRSPELRNRRPRREIDWTKTDIYAAGVILFELCCVVPRRQRETVFRKLLPLEDTKDPQLPDKFDEQHCEEVIVLIMSMTKFDASKRPSATVLRQGTELRTLSKKWKRKEKKRKTK